MLRPHNIIFSLALCLPALAALSPIGTVSSEGDITIGRARVPGHATLYDGSTIITGNSAAKLSLQDGTVVQLSPQAQATVHQGVVSLERGTSQVDSQTPYAVHVHAITLTSNSEPSRLRVALGDDGAVQVASLAGSFALWRNGANSLGTMIAGKAMTFSPNASDAGAVAPSQFEGCVAKTKNQLLLHDYASKSTLALEGDSIQAKAGDRVTVVGVKDPAASPVPGTTGMIRVLRLTVNGHGCSSKAGVAAAGAAGAATGAGIAGLSTATVVGIGVAAAGAAVIPTVALTSGSSSSSSSSISPQSR